MTDKKSVNAQKLVLQTQSTNRDVGNKLFNIAIVLGVSQVLLIIAMILVVMFNQPQDRYFALDNDLRVIELVPTNQPLLSDEKITRWTNEAINTINTLSFTHWRSELQSYSDKFTDKSFQDFLVQLRDSGNLELITSKRLNTIVMLSGGSKITKKGIDPSTGSFIWEVETPFVINYEGSQGVKATQRLVATTRITRVSTLETPVGIKIKSYVTTLRGGK